MEEVFNVRELVAAPLYFFDDVPMKMISEVEFCEYTWE